MWRARPSRRIFRLVTRTTQSSTVSVTPNTAAQNIFIAVINPIRSAATSNWFIATYLGGSGVDDAAGIAVSSDIDSGLPTSSIDVYVAGSTTSTDFPTNGALECIPGDAATQPGTHGFVTG